MHKGSHARDRCGFAAGWEIRRVHAGCMRLASRVMQTDVWQLQWYAHGKSWQGRGRMGKDIQSIFWQHTEALHSKPIKLKALPAGKKEGSMVLMKQARLLG